VLLKNVPTLNKLFEFEPCIHVLKAIRMIHISWRNVTPICISRCFEKAGFSMSLTSGNAEMQENSDSDDENDDDIPLANLFNIRNWVHHG
jgi:hypothetical protein